MSPRFLTLADVAETLNISAAQTYALVRSGDLRAIKVGGRGQWRVEAAELENYINTAYEQTANFLASNREEHDLPGPSKVDARATVASGDDALTDGSDLRSDRASDEP